MIVRKDLLCTDFFSGRGIEIPILDKDCFNIFFDSDDILMERVPGIHSVFFIFIKSVNGNCPVIKCRMNYNVLGSEYMKLNQADEYFIYDEITSSSESLAFQIRLEKFVKYVDEYFGKMYKEKIDNQEKGLELSFLFEFSIHIGCMGNYLIPSEEIVRQLNEEYVITHKKFC